MEPKKYRVVYDRENCIGAAACAAVNPERWQMNEDGKADLIEGNKNKENTEQTMIITEDELKRVKEAAEACPVNVIHIFDLETGERII